MRSTRARQASCKAIENFVSGLLLGYLKDDQDIPLGILQTMIAWAQGNYRLQHEIDFTALRFLDTASQTYIDLDQKFESLEISYGQRRAQ